jgi:hypothetical protein
MMENTPWIERYSIYNWVQASRAAVDNSNALTPTGLVYHNEVSHLSYLQDLPAGAGADATYLINSDALDSTGGGNDGMLVGAPAFISGKSRGHAIQLDGIHDYVQLPANVGNSANFTFAAWVNWNGGTDFQRIFDLGDGQDRFLFLTPSSDTKMLRFAITTGGISGEQRLETHALTPGRWTHVAVTISGATAKLYVDGALAATNTNLTVTPDAVGAEYNYLGKSQFPDPLFAGKLQHVFFAGAALTDAQVAAMAKSP